MMKANERDQIMISCTCSCIGILEQAFLNHGAGKRFLVSETISRRLLHSEVIPFLPVNIHGDCKKTKTQMFFVYFFGEVNR